MAQRYFNWKLAIVLLIGFAVLGTTALGLRQWQRANRADVALEAGIKAYDQQRWDEAARNLGRYLAVKGDDVPILLKYADAQLNKRPFSTGNTQQAVAAYRNVLRIDESNSEAAIRLVELYLAMGASGGPGEAELIARRQLKTSENPELRRLLAIALAAQRQFDAADAELKTILQKHPDQILAYETLGTLTERRPEDFNEPPSHWFDQAVKNNPSSALAHIVRASFYRRNDNKTQALAELQQAEQLDLSDPDIRLRLASEFLEVDALDKAEKHLAAVQEVASTKPSLWQTWARLALKSQSKAEMLHVAETGLNQLSKQPWDFMPVAAELFIRAGKPDRAADCIYKLRQKDMFPAGIAFLEGLVADQKGNHSEALKCWRRSIQLGNKSPLARLAVATSLLTLGDTQSALHELRGLVSDRPDYLEARLALARLSGQIGNYAEMAEHADRTRQISPGNAEAELLYRRAQIQLLAAQPTVRDNRWQKIQNDLANLEKSYDSLDVKLLQFRLAMARKDFSRAEALLAELKQEHHAETRVATAEAALLIAKNKPDEAISILEQAVKESPDAIEPVTYLAVLLYQQGDPQKCETTITDALTRVRQAGPQRELGLLLAALYRRWEQEDKAYRLLDSLTQKMPSDILLKRRLLACRQVATDAQRAQQTVDEIKSLEGEEGWQWRYEQARLWSAGDSFEARYPQIVALLQENLLANPDDQASRMLLAAAHYHAGELQLAVSAYRNAADRSPGDLRIIIPAVSTLYEAKDYEQADRILSRASEEKLYDPQLQGLQLQSYLRRGLLDKASDVLEDMLSSDPNNQAARLLDARLKMLQNNLAEASQLLDELSSREPRSPLVTSTQVELSIRQNKPDEALRLCDEMVEEFKNAYAYVLRARTYAAVGQVEKAMQDFEHATVIEPNNLQAWLAAGEFYRSAGQPEKAADCLKQALSLDPDNLQIQKSAISAFLACGDPEKTHQAQTILNSASASNPRDVDLRLFKARLLLNEATAPAIDNAQQILRKVTEDRPKAVQAWLLLGEISLRNGQPDGAADAAMRGLIHNRDDKNLLLLKARAEAAQSPTLAIPTLKGLHALNTNDVAVTVLLADTYIKAREPQEAVDVLQKHLASSKDDSDRRRLSVALVIAQAHVLLQNELWSELEQLCTDWCQDHPEDMNIPLMIVGIAASAEHNEAKKVAERLLRKMLQRDQDNVLAMNGLAMLLRETVSENPSAKP
jgi:tetratricopeptide (TPR) repeat protein